jgi:hypothetical protein
MLNLLTIEQFLPNKLSRKEHFSSKYKNGNEMPKYVIFLLLIINLIITYLFILFSLTYINEIDPNFTSKYKTVFLLLVYILLFTNGIMFIDNCISIYSLFTC